MNSSKLERSYRKFAALLRDKFLMEFMTINKKAC